MTVTVISEGAEQVVSEGELFVPDAIGVPLFANAIRIICAGANDLYGDESNYETHVKPLLDKMAARGGKYLIVSPWWGAEHPSQTTATAVEARMAEDYGEHYLNMRLMMVTEAEKTAEELGVPFTGHWYDTDGNGLVADDNVHHNEKGYRVKAEFIRRKLYQLEYVHDHIWSDWVVDQEPQIGQPGHKYRVCTVEGCDAREEAVIPGRTVTNALENASWGYTVRGLGAAGNEVAVVFTNENATAINWTVPTALENVQFLVVGGGGGGGGYAKYDYEKNGLKYCQAGAGGGGGAVVTGFVNSVSNGETFTIKVGAGGAGGTYTTSTTNYAGSAENGGNSSFSINGTTYITAYGGGGDGGYYKSSYGTSGKAIGGSNPGARGWYDSSNVNAPATEILELDCVGDSANDNVSGVECLRNMGGTGYVTDSGAPASGGGGALVVGKVSDKGSGYGGNGGEGLETDFTGETMVFGSGGGGGSSKAPEEDGDAISSGGTGAGYGRQYSDGTSAAPNQGGGGGGASYGCNGGNGGSGIVVLRYTVPAEADKPTLIEVSVPVAVTGLVYDGNVKTGVETGTGYTLTGNTATDAGEYTATATLADGYAWSDGSTDQKSITWTIAKATNTWKTEPAILPTTWEEGSAGSYTAGIPTSSTEVLISITKNGATFNGSLDALNSWEAGSYVIAFDVAESKNYTSLSKEVAVTVTAIENVTPPSGTIITTNSLANADWGYIVTGLGDAGNEVAVVFTNENATAINWTVPVDLQNVQFLVVGGGGGGGGDSSKNDSGQGGAGGGGGGVITGYINSVSAGMDIAVVVGKGGAGGALSTTATKEGAGVANKGGASSVSLGTAVLVSAEGGGCDLGAYGNDTKVGGVGGSGGSNAGSRVDTLSSISPNFLSYINSDYVVGEMFGNQGGAAYNVSVFSAGGGGGAIEPGDPSEQGKCAGDGGEGLACNITGETVVYGSGGGGGTTSTDCTPGQGGTNAGNGGDGVNAAASSNGGDGVANCGGGGGGAGDGVTTGGAGGSGGSGIVVLRYTIAADACVHSWGDWELDVESGNMTRTCERCEAVKTMGWGYKVEGLGTDGSEVALVFTNHMAAVMSWTVPADLANIEFLVVGGGGGGGADSNSSILDSNSSTSTGYGGAGGGGGGVITGSVNNVVAAGTVINITVGAGGAGGKLAVKNGKSEKGCASSVAVVTNDSTEAITIVYADGGGNDGGYQQPGGAGGSNGGCRTNAYNNVDNPNTYSYYDDSIVVAEMYGNSGGVAYSATPGSAGGGGGAMEPGSPSMSSIDKDNPFYNQRNIAGQGGEGLSSDITGTAVVYGSGGGGGNATTGTTGLAAPGGTNAGNGAGKNGTTADYKSNPVPSSDGGDGVANCGGGGGGAGNNSSDSNGNGGNGGSGIVVLRFVNTSGGEVIAPEIPSKVYTGETLTADVPERYAYTVVANVGGIDVGNYTVELQLKEGFTWKGETGDAATANKEITWSITPAVNSWTGDPSITRIQWTVNGTPGVLTDATTAFGTPIRTIGGAEFTELPATPGPYTVVYTRPVSGNWTWAEDAPETKEVSFTVYEEGAIMPLDKPAANPVAGSVFLPNGSVQKPVIAENEGYEINWGDTDWTTDGPHTVTITLKDGYKWQDEDEERSVTYTYTFETREFETVYYLRDGNTTDAAGTGYHASHEWYEAIGGSGLYPAGTKDKYPDDFKYHVRMKLTVDGKWNQMWFNNEDGRLDCEVKAGKYTFEGNNTLFCAFTYGRNGVEKGKNCTVFTNATVTPLPVWTVIDGTSFFVNHTFRLDGAGTGYFHLEANNCWNTFQNITMSTNLFVRFSDTTAGVATLRTGHNAGWVNHYEPTEFGWIEGGNANMTNDMVVEQSGMLFHNETKTNAVAGRFHFHIYMKESNTLKYGSDEALPTPAPIPPIETYGAFRINEGSTYEIEAGNPDPGEYVMLRTAKGLENHSDLTEAVINFDPKSYKRGWLWIAEDKTLILHVEKIPPKVIGVGEREAAVVFEDARIAKPIWYPYAPTINADTRKITWDGVTVDIPTYYDATGADDTDGGYRVNLKFNVHATPRIANVKDANGVITTDAIALDNNGVLSIHFENTHERLYYALRTSTSIEGLKNASSTREGFLTWDLHKPVNGKIYTRGSELGDATNYQFTPAESDTIRLFTVQVLDEDPTTTE